ncbi:MAG: tail fiber domain-containing protein [Draconibacterium sp.]
MEETFLLVNYGTNIDSDIMQLHGKLGMYLTRDYGEVVAYYKYSNNNKFKFNCVLEVDGLTNLSDKRLKTNIKELDNSLDLIKKVEGVSYNRLLNENDDIEKGNSETEKEKKGKEDYDKSKSKYKDSFENKKNIGFIAQDIQKIFPELVEEDESGYLSVNYIGLIPVLVEAIKELETRVETLENDCCNNIGNLKSGTLNGTNSNG